MCDMYHFKAADSNVVIRVVLVIGDYEKGAFLLGSSWNCLVRDMEVLRSSKWIILVWVREEVNFGLKMYKLTI